MTSLSPSIPGDRTADISRWRSLGAWFLFSLVLLMCISIDSPIHYMHPRCDSAIFYVAGRAWMNGLIPYVDFADSKGPLLWFIYGLGSLISPRSFLGMYFIEVILYTFTFFTLYLTGLKLGFCKRTSVAITALMALAFFFPVYHTEIKSEGLAQIFFALTLYGLVMCIKEGIRPWPIAAMGVTFGATLLMKYSMAPMVLAPFGILFLANLRSGHKLLKITVLYLIGGASVIIPFVLVLSFQGAWDSFIQEYFINTFRTVDHSGEHGRLVAILLSLKSIFLSPRLAVPVIISVGGVALFRFRSRIFAIATWTWLVCTLIILAMNPGDHYFGVLAIFWYFLFAAIFQGRLRTRVSSSFMWGVVAFAFVASNAMFYVKKGEVERLIFLKDADRKAELSKVAETISSIPNPRIAYYHTIEFCESVESGANPGIKYWTTQLGATPEMEALQEKEVAEGKANVVILKETETAMRHHLENIGFIDALAYDKYDDGRLFHIYIRK